MSTTPHPALARWLRQGGTAAHSAARWRAAQDRLDALALGLGQLPLLAAPWRALDSMPWVVAGQPQAVLPPAQGAVQARMQALLQVLSPATAGGAALPLSEAQTQADPSGRRRAPPTAAGTQPAVQGAMPVQAASQSRPAAGGQRPVPAPPRQPVGPPRASIGAAVAAARWLERATRAGLDQAFNTPLAQAMQPGPAVGAGQTAPAAALPGGASLARQGTRLQDRTGPHSTPLPPQQGADQPGGAVDAGRGVGLVGQGDGMAWGGFVRPLADPPRPAMRATGAGDAASGPADQWQGRVAARPPRAGQAAGGQAAEAWAQVPGLQAAPTAQAWPDAAPWVTGADGQSPRTGLRGLAQRASQALAAGVVQPGSAAGWAAGPAHVASAVVPTATTVPTALPTQGLAGLATRGSGGGNTAHTPPDDQQLLLQLARVLRREAERDGVDLSDTAP